jgi:hypothetical protein
MIEQPSWGAQAQGRNKKTYKHYGGFTRAFLTVAAEYGPGMLNAMGSDQTMSAMARPTKCLKVVITDEAALAAAPAGRGTAHGL